MERAQWIVFAGLIAGLLTAGSALAQTPEAVQCPGGLPPRLHRDFLAVVTPGTLPVNIRVAPGFRADRLGSLPLDTPFEVVDGPACADLHTWWEVSSGEVRGWAVEAQDADYTLAPYEPEPIATAFDGHVTVDRDVAAFQFDSSIAPAVSLTHTPEYQPSPDPDGWTKFAAPAGTVYTFFDGTQGKLYPHSTLTVYPAAGFAALHADQGAKIDALKALIADQSASADTEIPEVPGRNAAQMIRASIQYLTMADGGTGVRFLTYYAQANVPLGNRELRYEFRGFSADGSQYVRLEFGLQASVLPDRPVNGYWGENAFHKYGSHVNDLLTDLPPDQYTPNLALLDALVQTIRIGYG